MGYRDYSTAKGRIVDAAGFGDFSTIASALSAATAGETIFIRPGIYNEDLTLVAGVDLTAFPSDQIDVIIKGKTTISAAGTYSLAGIRFETDSDFCLNITGNAAVSVSFFMCFIDATDNIAINYDNSHVDSIVNFEICNFDSPVAGITWWTMSAAYTMIFTACDLFNNGLNTVPASNSDGSVGIFNCSIGGPVGSSGTGSIFITNSSVLCAEENAIGVTFAGTAALTGNNVIQNSVIYSGTQPCVTIANGITATVSNCSLYSANANIITGAGSLIYSGLSMPSGSYLINVTTQTGGTLPGSLFQNPSAGYLGEIKTASGTVALTTATAANIASIVLTPGVWDIRGIIFFSSTLAATEFILSIGTTSGTITATAGVDGANFVCNAAAVVVQNTLVVPAFRQTITVGATYYLVGYSVFAGTNSSTGTISATRVG